MRWRYAVQGEACGAADCVVEKLATSDKNIQQETYEAITGYPLSSRFVPADADRDDRDDRISELERYCARIANKQLDAMHARIAQDKRIGELEQRISGLAVRLDEGLVALTEATDALSALIKQFNGN